MSSKIFKTILIFLFLVLLKSYTFASSWDSIHIISRAEWWANESYRYLDSSEWKAKLLQYKNRKPVELTKVQKIKAIKEAQKVKKANNFLLKDYNYLFHIKNIEKFENWHKLAWPIVRVKNRFAIVIHDTDTNYWSWVDSYEAIRKIYKFHALTRWWGDIWYNYLIWYNWEIFEWRAGWDDVVWAHDKWNNQWAIGISMIWDYNNKPINKKQYESLKKLIKYLVKKYNIDLSKKTTFFKWCIWTWEKCIKKPLVILHNYPIIWHRDAWYTLCPWQKLYEQLQELKKQLNVWVVNKNTVFLKKIDFYLKRLKENKLLNLLAKIELVLDKNIDWNKKLVLNQVKSLILNIENNKLKNIFSTNIKKSFDDNNKIKVKLSYPFDEYINLQVKGEYNPRFLREDNQDIISFINNNSKEKVFTMNLKLLGNDLILNWKKILDFNKVKFFRISVPKWNIIKIISWNRKPKWDKSWKLNDNEFKWDIVLYLKNNKLVVVNDIYLSDYLKWLWEVSNDTNPEKIKAIIVLARTYARWYMIKARKFIWEWYDANDDPNIFQKYLWFGIEKRSPKVDKLVDQTKDLVITYDWKLIKPWYFSVSNWKTVSFLDYCKNHKWIPDCRYPQKFPFLLWVMDPGWIWKKQIWHWIWVSWTWIQYFANKWWNFDMIIKYFLKWIEIRYF